MAAICSGSPTPFWNSRLRSSAKKSQQGRRRDSHRCSGDYNRSDCRQEDYRGMGQLGSVRDAEADQSLREPQNHSLKERIVRGGSLTGIWFLHFSSWHGGRDQSAKVLTSPPSFSKCCREWHWATPCPSLGITFVRRFRDQITRTCQSRFSSQGVAVSGCWSDLAVALTSFGNSQLVQSPSMRRPVGSS